MSGTQKRGFRLPWAPERGSDDGAPDGAAAATADPEGFEAMPALSDDPGEGPFGRASTAAHPQSMDAAPAASHEPAVTTEADMIETEPTSPASRAGSSDPTAGGGAWDSPRPAIHVEAAPTRIPRRENPLVAGLVKAMREAALASREETTNRLRAEADARVEAIKAGSTDAAAALRKRADEDIAGIREWSKAEIARVRQDTEDQIEGRRVQLAGETQRQAAGIDQLVEEVQSTVAAYEADMDEFFERLLAENDPARVATLAEQAPEPPDLSGDGEGYEDVTGAQAWGDAMAGEASAAAADRAVLDSEPETASQTDGSSGPEALATAASEVAVEKVGIAEAMPEAVEDAPVAQVEHKAEVTATADELVAEPEPQDPPEALEAAAAAEAEAEATEGLDMVSPDRWPAAVLGGTNSNNAGSTPAPQPDAARQSRLLVSGLTSVAGIAAFKGAVGGLPSVRSVSVSSGERGVFIFTVSHDSSADVAEAVAGLTGFAVRITETSGDTVSLTAHEPAA